jgi:two-component sensor histidine kinase
LGEMTHRVRNEYASVISRIELAAARSKSAEARATLQEMADRLHNYASLHRALQVPLTSQVDLSEYLRALCTALERSTLGRRSIRFIPIGRQVLLPSELCWYIALIVCELVTNATKHAGGTRSTCNQRHIDVELAVEGTCLVCRVRDCGTWKEHPPRRGTHIVHALASRIGATLTRSSSEAGTTMLLIITLDLSPTAPA